jgi:hypothetical protein
MMISRVSLLLVVTGLFAGMWSADGLESRTVTQQQLVRRAPSRRASDRVTVPATGSSGNASLSGNTAAKTVPLPKGIAPGTYLVVDQAGITQRLTISARRRRTANHSTVEQYTVRSGGNRWHFIRLEERQPVPQMHEVTAAALR